MALPAKTASTGPDGEEITVAEVATFLSGRILTTVENLPERLINMSEADLIAELVPTPLDYSLRRNFWDRLERIRSLGKSKLPTSNIWDGVCSKRYFEESFIHQPLRVAFLIRPPVAHEAYYEAVNKACIQKLLDYAMNPDNKVSEKNLSAIIKLAEMSANRAYGAVVQKIQTKNLNLEARVDAGQAPPAADAQQLEARARELQQKLVEGTIDVTPTSED